MKWTEFTFLTFDRKKTKKERRRRKRVIEVSKSSIWKLKNEILVDDMSPIRK